MNTKHLGRAIKVMRKRQRISQEDLALEAKISRRYMSDVENGLKNAGIHLVIRIAEALNTSTSILIALAENIAYKELVAK